MAIIFKGMIAFHGETLLVYKFQLFLTNFYDRLMGRYIQKLTLPHDWFTTIMNNNITSSSLSKNEKIIAECLIKYIGKNGDRALYDRLSAHYVKSIISNAPFLPQYVSLPSHLVEEAINELKNKRGNIKVNGLEFSIKLHSIFIEFLTYIDLLKLGYSIEEFTRKSGSCDFTMRKGHEKYNVEVKFKQNDDVAVSRYYDIIDGLSLLEKNAFLQGKHLEIDFLGDISTTKEITDEIELFINYKTIPFEGSHIIIDEFPSKNRSSNLATRCNRIIRLYNITPKINEKCNIISIIENLFIGEGKHLTNLEKKSKKFNNFIGCLSWVIPYNLSINNYAIEEAFRKVFKPTFELHIFISTKINEPYHFTIEKIFCP